MSRAPAQWVSRTQQPQSQPQLLLPQLQLFPQPLPQLPPQPPQKRMRIRMIHRQLFPLFQHIVKNLPVKMETLVGLSSSYALHVEGVTLHPVCAHGGRRETLDARQRSGTPRQTATPGDLQGPQCPAWLRQDNPSRLKMTHTPGAGQAGRRRPRAPRVDQQTAKQDGPSRSRDRPTARKIDKE